MPCLMPLIPGTQDLTIFLGPLAFEGVVHKMMDVLSGTVSS